MTDFLRHATPGDPMNGIPAETYNLMLECIKDLLRRRKEGSGRNVAPSETTVHIKNVSGADRGQFSIVGLGAKLVGPLADLAYFFGPSVFDSASPAADASFAIIQLPAKQNAIVIAKASGDSFCKVSLSDVNHEYAAPGAGVYGWLVSQSGVGPAKILKAFTPAATQLDGGIDDSVTTITVDSFADYPLPSVVTIGTEDLNVTARLGETQIDGAIDDTVGTIIVDSASDFPATPFVGKINSEKVNVTNVVSQTLTVSRGHLSTTAAAHADGSTFEVISPIKLTVARGHNSTTPSSHADNAAVAFKSGTVWALVMLTGAEAGGGSGDDTTINGEDGPDFTLVEGTGIDIAVTDTNEITISSTVVADVDSDIYTPTVTAGLNVSSIISVNDFTWMRIGDIVTVSGRVALSCTAASPTLTTVSITLPTADSTSIMGGGTSCYSSVDPGDIIANGSTVIVTWLNTLATTGNLAVVFSYHID